MKRLLLLLVLNYSFLIGAVEITRPLLELLKVTKVEHQGTYGSILQETQKKWLRPPGKERWEISDLDEKINQQIFPLADQLGFVSEILPCSNEYQYAAVLGGTFERMEKRLEFLIQLWNQGIRFKNLLFLTGQRPLDPTIEPVFAGCHNESEAAHYIWAHHLVPEEMKSIPVQFVEVPMKEGTRPTTKDTYNAWLSTQPKPGSILLISNQPYCPYQHELAVSTLPESFSIETVGAAIEEKNGGSPKQVMLEHCEAQVSKMQGAAESGLREADDPTVGRRCSATQQVASLSEQGSALHVENYQNGAVLLDSIARWIFAGGNKLKWYYLNDEVMSIYPFCIVRGIDFLAFP